MKRLITALVGAAMLAAFGCGGGDEGGGEQAPEFPVPLAVGNWWFSQSVNDTSSWDTTKIVGDTVYDGHDAFVGVSVYRDSDSLAADTVIAYYADSFLVLHRTLESDSMSIEVNLNMFKQNLAVGDTWTVFNYDTSMGGLPLNMRMWATVIRQSDTTVAAGSFNGCYVVLDTTQISINGSPMQTDVQTMWLAYGVGVVYTESSDDTSQLVDYHVE